MARGRCCHKQSMLCRDPYGLLWHLSYLTGSYTMTELQKENTLLKTTFVFLLLWRAPAFTWRFTLRGLVGGPEVAGNCCRCLDEPHGCHLLFLCALSISWLVLKTVGLTKQILEESQMFPVCLCFLDSCRWSPGLSSLSWQHTVCDISVTSWAKGLM